jgi:hypothetical protein
MALTLDQLTELVETLQNRVDALEPEVRQYRQDILELEQQLAQSIRTQQLAVQGEAQISGRNVLVDGQMLDTHEGRLNSHDLTLNVHSERLVSHDATLSAHDGALSAHDGRLNSHDGTLSAHDGRLNSHDGTLSAHESRLNDFAQSISIPGDIQFGSILRTPGRMHIDGGELLYLLNKNGVVVGKEWGGTGDLWVQGNLVVNGDIVYAGTIRDSNPPPPPPPIPFRDRTPPFRDRL